jgi:hypothetical protein
MTPLQPRGKHREVAAARLVAAAVAVVVDRGAER